MSFVKSPTVKLTCRKGMLSFKVSNYLGHNPPGAAVVIVLLSGIALVSFAGMINVASEESGPLTGTVFPTLSGDWMEDINPGTGKENQS
jgi:cytochrome b